MDLGLKGRVAVVTGSPQGIGRAAAIMLANEGARVVIPSDDAVTGTPGWPAARSARPMATRPATNDSRRCGDISFALEFSAGSRVSSGFAAAVAKYTSAPSLVSGGRLARSMTSSSGSIAGVVGSRLTMP
jgi:NAD(P)-dependent dehydrogenase (short-subunit alcohol dehydrogenase family)